MMETKFIIRGRKSGKTELERRMIEKYLAEHPDVILKEIRLKDLKPKSPEPYVPNRYSLEPFSRHYAIDKLIEESWPETQWLKTNPHIKFQPTIEITNPGEIRIISFGINLASDKE